MVYVVKLKTKITPCVTFQVSQFRLYIYIYIKNKETYFSCQKYFNGIAMVILEKI